MSARKRLRFFDVAVLDTNFFIGILEAGVEEIIPELQEITTPLGLAITTSADVPRGDIPSMFRILRSMIPGNIPLTEVNRTTDLWKDLRKIAAQERMIKATEDPVDVDILYLALEFAEKGKRVAIVSDDTGVARGITLPHFQGKLVDHLSCGAFMSILSAGARNPQQRKMLDKGLKAIFRQSWDYRRKTRSYIDIKMLVDDLVDTAVYVRTVSTARKRARSAKKASSKRKKIPPPAPAPAPEPEPVPMDMDAFDKIIPLLDTAREARLQGNVSKAEELLPDIMRTSSKVLTSLTSAEQRVMLSSMVAGEMFDHYVFLLHSHLRRNEFVQVIAASQSCIALLNFLYIDIELYENIVVLQGLVYLLLGENARAVSLFTKIDTTEITQTQRLGLIVGNVVAGKPQEAKKLSNQIPDDQIPDLIASIHSYSSEAFSRGRTELTVQLLSFLLTNFSAKTEIIRECAQQLFIATRLQPDLLHSRSEELTRKLLGALARDETHKPMPRSLTSLAPLEITPEHALLDFLGRFYILQVIPIGSEGKMEVIAFLGPLRSVVRVIFPMDIAPALTHAMSFELKGGMIAEMRPRRPHEKRIRGTFVVDDPVLQVTVRLPWD
ncbi:MAG: hypothetical protein ACXACI_03750 [Candidatus Hodarchaeales archaeon]|jgi:hypothetical protein